MMIIKKQRKVSEILAKNQQWLTIYIVYNGYVINYLI